jgi:hypothetical protein
MLLMRWAFVTRALPVLVRVRRKNSAGERESAPIRTAGAPAGV